MDTKLKFSMDYAEYVNRYTMLFSEEELEDQLPELMSEKEFGEKRELIIDSYTTYNELLEEGKEHEASMYMVNVLAPLEELFLL